MKKMLQNKANCNHKDLIKQTPLFYACRENQLEAAKLLIENGSNVNVIDHNKHSPYFYAKE